MITKMTPLTWLACTIESSAAETSALELETPELGGMLPHTAARIPAGTDSAGIISSAPFTPHRKYLYQVGPFSLSLMRDLKARPNYTRGIFHV